MSGKSGVLGVAAAVALLLAIPAILFWETTLPGKVLATAGTEHKAPWSSSATPEELALPQMNADSVRENLAYRVFLGRTLGEGRIPWWSPYSYGGIPFVALNHTEVLYPPVWLASRLDPYRSYGALIAFHLAVAGLGMLLFLRSARLPLVAALFGALVFMLNGMFLTRHGHPQYVATGCWLPWCLLAVSWLFGARRAAGVALLGAASALAILAGHPSVYVYGAYFVGCYGIGRFLIFGDYGHGGDYGRGGGEGGRGGRGLLGRESWPGRMKGLLGMVLGVAIGAGLASTQLLATLELSQFSDRSERSLASLLGQLPHWSHLLRALYPGLLGNPLEGSYWSVSPTSFTGGILYAGVAPLVLAGLGVLRGGRRGAFLGVLTLGSLGLMYVPALYRVGYHLLPGLRFSRIDRLSIAFFLGVSILAALGLAGLLEGRRGQRFSPAQRGGGLAVAGGLAVLGLLLATLALTVLPGLLPADGPADAVAVARRAVAWGTLLWCGTVAWLFAAWRGNGAGSTLLAVAVLALTVFDLGSFARPFVVARDAERVFRPTPATELLGRAEGPFRISRLGGQIGPNEFSLFPANLPLAYGIEDLHGFGPLHLRDLDRIVDAIEPGRKVSPKIVRPLQREASLASPLLDVLAVRYVLTDRPVSLPDYRLVHEGDLTIYENTDALSLVSFLGSWLLVDDPETAARRLAAPGAHDPRRTVLLERDPGLGAGPRDVSESSVRVVARQLGSVSIEKRGPDAGVLRLADPFYPGWTARIDGRAVELLRADGFLRAVVVPAGDHEIHFEYRPTYWRPAAWATAAGGLAWLASTLLALRPRAGDAAR